ncbi:DUF4190 domain-containing protein [Virgisporangium aurantiacum]|uniref:DUF4190 domain-containing protein n=1 Tax=Virgisporangium aurantiacum TaxID=175570 RepID=A0A8J4E0R7_9ACTN|nr:DUF4190 domain-containing protein [Virgisporangium aurantiacum]GIJ57234.1 hypothetical protein Vau01_047500 [Virgisporangium aurantiacum]
MSADDRAPLNLPRAPALRQVDPHIGGTNKLAVASFIFAIMGGALVAIIVGHVALVQIRRYGQDGAGLAVTGLVIGYLGLAFWLVMIVLIRNTPG